MDTELYKVRSVSRCIADAFTLFADNFKKIVGRTKWPALAFAVTMGAFVYLAGSIGSTSGSIPVLPCVLLLVLFLASMACACWLGAAVIGLLNGEKPGKNIKRVGNIFLLMIGWALLLGCACVVAMVAFTASDPAAVHPGQAQDAAMVAQLSAPIGVVLLICLLFYLMILPAYYSAMKYLMEPAERFSGVLGKNFRKGWRYWGFLFCVLLVAGLLAQICAWVIQLPVTVLTFAENLNTLGIGMGDADGMPAWFGVAKLLTMIVCLALYIYVSVWEALVVYFAYGSVEAKIRLREEQRTGALAATLPDSAADYPEITE